MKKLLIIAALSSALMAGAHGALAQADMDNDLQPLMDRMNRLERDVARMQSQLYRRGGDDGGAPVVSGDSNPAAAEMRSEQFSEQMRDLTGRIEEVKHDVDALRTRLDKMATDTDMRLQALEHGGAAASGLAMNNPPEPEAAPPPRSRNDRPPNRSSANLSPPPPPDQQTAMAPDTSGGALPNGSPQQQYDFAFGLLRDANYPAAERALRDFVARYPTNRLASNAQYWLGETYFVRGRYQAAAAAFAEGYQKYPKGPKAADDLLKLGSALAMLGRKADACRSFAQLDRDFPIAPSNLKQREAQEKAKAACR